MHAPSAAELLDAWERGLDQPGPDRALCLLAVSMPDASPASLARMPIGRRGVALIAFLEVIFGPACAHGWESSFDVDRYLWEEVHAWAIRTLQDVHILASSYGWREAEILALSQVRRQFYLELAQS